MWCPLLTEEAERFPPVEAVREEAVVVQVEAVMRVGPSRLY